MTESSDFKFNLGDRVKDTITSFTGIVECRTQWLYNCNTYCVKSQELHEGKPIDRQVFDEPQLIIEKDPIEVKIKVKKSKKKDKPGGPCVTVHRTNRL